MSTADRALLDDRLEALTKGGDRPGEKAWGDPLPKPAEGPVERLLHRAATGVCNLVKGATRKRTWLAVENGTAGLLHMEGSSRGACPVLRGLSIRALMEHEGFGGRVRALVRARWARLVCAWDAITQC